jgi:hypothetical protein
MSVEEYKNMFGRTSVGLPFHSCLYFLDSTKIFESNNYEVTEVWKKK